MFLVTLLLTTIEAKVITLLIPKQFYNVNINYINGELSLQQLCNVIRYPHGMLGNNARKYITEQMIINQLCYVKLLHNQGTHLKQ